MNDTILQGLALLAGTVLGAGFFGGLWLTVRFALTSSHANLVFALSLGLRCLLLLSGLFFVSAGSGSRLALCVLGIVGARPAMIHLSRSQRRIAHAT